jgi:SAM-dependent methyltransferase
MDDADAYRELNARLWEALAEPWDRRRQWQETVARPITETLLRQLDPQPGQTVLELAGGNGETGLLAARALGATGRLILTDLAPAMVETAKRRGQELGATNVDYQVMDAEHIKLEDDSVDGVVCRWGYMLMPDGNAALAETRRVLRAGGQLSFAVWAEAADNPFFTVPGGVLAERGYLKPGPSTPNLFSLGTPEKLESFVQRARFETPAIERVPITYRFADRDDWWSFVSEFAGPVAFAVAKLDEPARREVRAMIEQRSEQFRDGEGYAFPGVSLVVSTK